MDLMVDQRPGRSPLRQPGRNRGEWNCMHGDRLSSNTAASPDLPQPSGADQGADFAGQAS